VLELHGRMGTINSMCVLGRHKMARPIEPTPALKGKDARIFAEKMNAAVMTPERLKYLQSAAASSKRAESKRK
jgi:hypothetical protein